MVVVVPQIAVKRVETRKVVELGLDIDGILLLCTGRKKGRREIDIEEGVPVVHDHVIAAREDPPFLHKLDEFVRTPLRKQVGVVTEMEVATRRRPRWRKERVRLDLGEEGGYRLDDVGKRRFVRGQDAAQVDNVGVCRKCGRHGKPLDLPVGLELDVVLHDEIGRELLVVCELFPQRQMRQRTAHDRLLPLEVVVAEAVSQRIGEFHRSSVDRGTHVDAILEVRMILLERGESIGASL